MLKAAIAVGLICFIFRLISIVILLDGKSGEWRPLHGTGYIIALVQGIWAVIDVFMIIGARKKIKAFLMIWLIFALVRLVGYIYNCIKIGNSSLILLGVNLGAFLFVVTSCGFVGLSIYHLDEENKRLKELKETEQNEKFINEDKMDQLDLVRAL